MTRLAYLVFALVLLAPSAAAQVVSIAGVATSSFGSGECDAPVARKGKPRAPDSCVRPSALDLRQVQDRAVMNALERYATSQGQSTIRNFELVRDSVSRNLDAFVLGVLELGRTVDTTSRRVTIEVSVDVNEGRLLNVIQGASETGKTAVAERSLIGLFFFARQESAVEQLDPQRRETTQARVVSGGASEGDTTRAVKESGRVAGDTVTLRDSVRAAGRHRDESEVAIETTRSGSRTFRADVVTYAVASSEDLNAVLGGLLSAEGFETVEGGFLEEGAAPSVSEALREEFSVGDDLRPSTLRRVMEMARRQDVSLILVGTATVGLPGVDAVSGNQRVFVKVSGKVYDVSGRLPRVVLNVAPEEHSGLGPDASVARTNALTSAGSAVAREIVARLNARKVK